MSNTSNLVLPYLAVGQAQKHVTVNETLRKLDAVIQLSVVSATTTAEPVSPTDGAVYIIPSGKSGPHWAAFANWSLGYYRDGAWVEIAPREGWLAFVKDTDQLLAFTGSAWSLFPAAKLLTLSATDKLLGRSTSGAGAAEEIACTAAGRALIDDADAAAQRATLGLGTAALKNTGASGNTVPLLDGANTWSAAQTFSNEATLSSALPIFRWNETDAGANAKNWLLGAQGGVFYFQSINDAQSGAADIFTVNRSGQTPTAINFGAVVQPGSDNAYSCGGASFRWSTVYAATGAINTSDAREKTEPRPFEEAERRAIRSVLQAIGVFQWLGAIEAKQEAARLHVGVTAQAVAEAFAAEGLDPARYALFCADPLEEEIEVEETVRIQRPVSGPDRETIEIVDGKPVLMRKPAPLKRIAPVLNDKGEAVLRGGEALTCEVGVTEEVEVRRPVRIRRPVLDGQGEPVMRLGLRYDQIFAMALAALL